MRRLHVVSLLLAVALSFIAGRATVADDEPTRLPLTEKDIPPPRVDWYGLYMKDASGTKVGWVRIEFGRAGEGANAAWLLEVVARIQMTSMGKQVEMDLEERHEYEASAPFAFRGAKSTIKQGPNEQRVEITRVNGKLEAKVTVGGEERKLPVAASDYTLADELTV